MQGTYINYVSVGIIIGALYTYGMVESDRPFNHSYNADGGFGSKIGQIVGKLQPFILCACPWGIKNGEVH